MGRDRRPEVQGEEDDRSSVTCRRSPSTSAPSTGRARVQAKRLRGRTRVGAERRRAARPGRAHLPSRPGLGRCSSSARTRPRTRRRLTSSTPFIAPRPAGRRVAGWSAACRRSPRSGPRRRGRLRPPRSGLPAFVRRERSRPGWSGLVGDPVGRREPRDRHRAGHLAGLSREPPGVGVRLRASACRRARRPARRPG